MKKSGILILVLALFVIFSLSVFAYLKMTGMVSFTAVSNCVDSDMGQDYTVKGDIVGDFYNGTGLKKQPYSYQDKCLSGMVLLEYYCNLADGANYERASINYECKFGCKDGACSNAPAYESTDKPLSNVLGERGLIAKPCNFWCKTKLFFGIE